MPRYADPLTCPDCRRHLPPDPGTCPTCDLPLRGPLAVDLFTTLRSADDLLLRLRATIPDLPVPGPAPVARPERLRRGLSGLSVPRILLGLGALCLLVAAVTFLAVAWSWLGIGGRTAVLVALTVLTATLGGWLGTRGLRVAAESLTVVALGLLTLDVLGAENAGWLGDPGGAGTACLVGSVLALGSLVLLLAPARLVAPQLGAGLGLWVVATAATGLTSHDQVVAGTAVVAFACLAALGRLLSARVLPWVALAGGLAWEAVLAGSGLAEGLTHATLRGLWIEGHGVALGVACVLALLPVLFAAGHSLVARTCATTAATLATLTLALPATDDGPTALGVVALGSLLLWSAVHSVTARTTRGPAVVAAVPLALSALPVLAVSIALLTRAGWRVLEIGAPFTRAAGVRLPDATTWAHPGLLVPSLAGLLVAALALSPAAARTRWLREAAGTAAVVLVLGATSTLALTSAPLWTIVATLCLPAAAVVAAGVRRTDLAGTAATAAGVVLALLAVVSALPSDRLTTGALTVLVLAAAVVLTAGRSLGAQLLAGAVLPAATAGLIWSGGATTDVDAAWRAAPILVAVGLLALLRPAPEVEVSAALAAVLAAAPAVSLAAEPATSLALHLTLAGALVSASALVHASRRPLGWVGGFLLAAATWVRLADLEVQAPEAYTLPCAVALLLVGLRRLHLDPRTATMTALAPALTLLTTPSLLWVVFTDAASGRAVLLGLGCLALVLVGVRLRWTAPLLGGAAAGAALVLRELAPYAAATPQWVLIGLAGTLLTVVGITWERRLADLQHAASYVGRLR